MMFTNNFVTIELSQGETTTTTVELIIRLKRNSEYLKNQKGLVLETQAHNSSETVIDAIWYTEKGTLFEGENPVNIKYVNQQDGFHAQDTPSLIGDGVVFRKTYELPQVFQGKIRKQAELRINVRLWENVPKPESRVVISGNIVLKATPIRDPRVSYFKQNFVWHDDKYFLEVESRGHNPHSFYEKYLDLGWGHGQEIGPDVNDFFSVELPESMWGKKVPASLSLRLNGEVESEMKHTFNMPTAGVKAFIKIDGEFKEVKTIWIKRTPPYMLEQIYQPVHRAYLIEFGKAITRD